MNDQTPTVIAFAAYYQISDDKINLTKTHLFRTKGGWIVRTAVL